MSRELEEECRIVQIMPAPAGAAVVWIDLEGERPPEEIPVFVLGLQEKRWRRPTGEIESPGRWPDTEVVPMLAPGDRAFAQALEAPCTQMEWPFREDRCAWRLAMSAAEVALDRAELIRRREERRETRP